MKHLLRCHINDHPIGRVSLRNKHHSDFITEARSALNKMQMITLNDLKILQKENSKINKMYYAYYYYLKISESCFFNKDQGSMIKRIERYNLTTIGDVITERKSQRFPKITLDIYQLYNSIPNAIRLHLKSNVKVKECTLYMLPYKLNIWKDYKSIKSKDLRIRLQQPPAMCYKKLLVRKHSSLKVENINYNPFSAINSITINKLQDVQYKLLHNIYPTMYHLRKWKIKSNDQCGSCGVVDDLRHCIYDCNVAKITITNLTDLLKSKYNIEYNVQTYEHMLLGHKATKKDNQHLVIEVLDTILVIIKKKINSSAR